MRHSTFARIALFGFALAGLAGTAAAADNCTIDLKADDLMKFDKASVTVAAACPTITINLEHTGKLAATAMGHNVVISATDVFQQVAQDGMTAGVDASYVKAGDTRVIAHTKVIGGGEKTSATFPGGKLTAGGKYTFFCSFPGHYAIMKGELVVQ